MTDVKLNFVTPINKIFPSPLSSSVFLVLNESGDLSLYRNKEHVWSAGRFKLVYNVEWSPDGKFFAVQGDKKYFVYSAEDGKRLNVMKLDSFETTESSACRWIKMNTVVGEEIILAVIDLKNFCTKWSVNCEFELKGGRLLLESNEPIDNFQIDSNNNDLLISQPETGITKFKFPFDPQQDTSVLHMSQLSKHLQSVLRVVDELRGQMLKLLKLDDSVYMRISDIDVGLMRKYLLFGNYKVQQENTPLFPELNENEVLEWKSKLKKQHVELLVSIEEVSSVLRSFQASFPNFHSTIVDKFLFTDLPAFDDKSRSLQHDLAEFLVWLEALIIPDPSTNTYKTIKPFAPDTRALSLAKSLQRSEGNRIERHDQWCNGFDDFKGQLEAEFKSLVSKINSVDLSPYDTILKETFICENNDFRDQKDSLSFTHPASNQLYTLKGTTLIISTK